MGNQVVEEVRTADGVDVLVGLRPELVLDLAPDVVALVLDHAGSWTPRAGRTEGCRATSGVVAGSRGVLCPSEDEHLVLGLRLFLGDHGAADGHDDGDDA